MINYTKFEQMKCLVFFRDIDSKKQGFVVFRDKITMDNINQSLVVFRDKITIDSINQDLFVFRENIKIDSTKSGSFRMSWQHKLI